jgi:hypothetical protein
MKPTRKKASKASAPLNIVAKQNEDRLPYSEVMSSPPNTRRDRVGASEDRGRDAHY